MKITKLEHSGLIFEKAGQQLVSDPVEFNQQLPEMSSVAAIVITHKHGDHFQPEKLAQILAQNPTAKIFATTDLDTDEIAGHPIEKVEAGVVWDLAGFHLEFFGRDHAPIVPGVVPCRNIGTVIDGEVVNPGDSFDLPENLQSPKVLLVTSAAPWCKVSEGMAYIKQAKPKIAVPVHDAVLSDLGSNFNNNWLTQAATEVGAKLIALQPGESLEV